MPNVHLHKSLKTPNNLRDLGGGGGRVPEPRRRPPRGLYNGRDLLNILAPWKGWGVLGSETAPGGPLWAHISNFALWERHSHMHIKMIITLLIVTYGLWVKKKVGAGLDCMRLRARNPGTS